MSEKIYFNASNRFSLKRTLVNATTRLHYAMAPIHAKKTAQNFLLTPTRMLPKNDEPNGLLKNKIGSHEGELSTYQLGSGPVWLFVHGWSGAANQFYPLMEYVASQGFTALAYDHPAHGNSSGKHGHMPAFVSGLEAVLDSIDNIVGVVGHSMGGAAILECKHDKIAHCSTLLIAPVLDYVTNLWNSIIKSGYSLPLFEAVVADIAEQYHYPIQSIDPYQKLARRQSKTLIVHDEHDRFTEYAVSKKAANSMENVSLITTQNQGHSKIMTSEYAKQAFEQLITYLNDERK